MKRYRLAYSQSTRVIVALALAALVLLVFVPSSMAAPEPPSIEWSKSFNGFQATAVIQTSDGGYAIAGKATSGSITFVKTNASGTSQWEQAVGNLVGLAQRESGYVVFGENGNVLTTDVDGNVQSTFPLGVSGTVDAVIATDGNYILVGNSYLPNGEPYAWLRKVDTQGNILWDNIQYTGGIKVAAVVATNDRGCVMAGNSKNDFWICKLDKNHNEQWSQTYAFGAVLDEHFAYSLVETKDGGFILAGTGNWQNSNGMIPWLLKIDSEGHRKWDLPYPQYSPESYNEVVQASDEGYLVLKAGTAMLIRTDPGGSELWQIPLGFTGGLTSSNLPSDLIRTKDGGYALVGSTWEGAFLVKISPETDLQAPTVAIVSPKSKTYETSDLPLTFKVNEQVTWLSYSLDGQEQVTIDGNTTLTGLSVGAHSVTVYARDQAGLLGTSETIQFTIAARFPTELVIAGVGVAIAASLSFLLYVKRRSLSDFKKRGVRSLLKKQSLVAIGKNRLSWTVIIISLCFILVFVQVFFPYFYYSSSNRTSSSFEVGVSYVYETDTTGEIYGQVSRIKELGFDVIRINLVCDSNNPGHYLNTLSDVFFSAVRELGVKVALIINNHASLEDTDFFLNKWGGDLTYIQILNEPDVASSWEMGALFTDDEAGSRFEEVYSIVEQHQLSAMTYTNFGPAFIARTNLPVKFSEKLDFVGMDVFMDSFLTISPPMIQLLQKITNKEIVIAEYGMSSSDDQAQSDYIIKGLNLFRNMNLRGCWIVYWNSVNNYYGIRGRLAEQKVGEWIAENS